MVSTLRTSLSLTEPVGSDLAMDSHSFGWQKTVFSRLFGPKTTITKTFYISFQCMKNIYLRN